MNAAASLPYQPHDSSGGIRSFIFAAVIHVLLIGFLYFGINWSTSKPPAAAMADLWTGLPANTTPPPPPPPRVETPPEPPKPDPKPVIEEPKPVPPPPVEAEIKLKDQKKVEPKKKKEPPPKEEKKEVAKKDPPKKKEEPKKEEVKSPPMDDIQKELAKEMQKSQANQIARQAQRESQQMAAAGAQGSSDAWQSKVAALVRNKVPINIAAAVPGNPTAVFEVTLIPSSRDVISVKLITSSGNAAYDEAAAQAIQASSPLPPLTPGMAPLPRILRFEATPKPK